MFPLNASNFLDIYSNGMLYIYVGISIANGILLFFASLKFLLVLQQCGYHGTRYFKWLGNRETPYLSRLMLLSMLGLLFFMVLNMCFIPVLGTELSSFVGFVSYILFTVLYIDSEKNVNAKMPLKKTKRIVRLSITYCIELSIFTFAFMALMNFLALAIGDEVFAVLRLAIICIMPLCLPVFLFVAYCTNELMEFIIQRRYTKRATNKLKRHDIIKIGITGSYGKTSIKEILKTILSQKYRVLATPESYNTPLGISLTVNKLDGTHDVFIAEMGARNRGDIKELSLMVNPQYGVLTGINNQHLETFRTEENIKNTKYELFENLAPNGVGFFSSDNDGAGELHDRFGGKKYYAGLSDKENVVTATDIKTTTHGTEFLLNIKGEKSVNCSTVLLGKHSISNICLAASVAHEIGMTAEEIAAGINRIQSIGHRLELVPNNKNIVIIDNSYNLSESGISACMEVLDMFEGRKIVLTPGLVELGIKENLANFEFGKVLAKHADKVIIIGTHNAEMLIGGLLEEGFKKENITFAKTLKKGNEELNLIMKEGDVVLFANDLPDNYN